MGTRLPATQYGQTIPAAWRQFLSGKGWVGDMKFGPDGASVALQIDTNWDDLDTVVLALLGKAEKSGASIARTLPMRHPRWPNLTCTAVTGVEGVRFRGRSAANANGAVAEYDIARLTCLFTQRPYKLLTDAACAGQEWKRWTQYKGKDTVEMLQRDKGNYVWEEGPGAGNDYEGPSGQLLAGSRLLWI